MRFVGVNQKDNKMPPNSQENTCTGVLNETDCETIDGGLARDVTKLKEAGERNLQLIWRNIIVFSIAHLLGIYGLWLICTSARVYTPLFALALYLLSILGITAGVHRLWSHRAYKANTPLRIFLVLISTIPYQNSAYHWAREHRVHHKYSETNADPVNATRGFFFSHVGWLLCKKHPDVTSKGKGVDMSDLKADPIVAFQHKHYGIMTLIIALIIPLVTPVYYWNESWTNSLCIAVMLRWVCSLNATWLVNSAAHKFGSRPYDRNLNPAENLSVSTVTLGEGFHNYHHVFPWDYKTAELQSYQFNWTTAFIDFCAKFGWAYDLKSVSEDIVKKRVDRTGDGSHNLWGWGDPEQDPDEKKHATITHRQK